MSVTTYQNRMEETVVRLEAGCTNRMLVVFKTRKDALALLLALRKRVRK